MGVQTARDPALELDWYRRQVHLLWRADEVAASDTFEQLSRQLLSFFAEVTGATNGLLYLYNRSNSSLVIQELYGSLDSALINEHVLLDASFAGRALRTGTPSLINGAPRSGQTFAEIKYLKWRTLCSLPLITSQGQVAGVVQLCDIPVPTLDDPLALDLLHTLARRLATDLLRAQQLAESQRIGRRRESLIETISLLTSTLDRQQLLTLIMDRARTLLNSEATSIFMVEKASGDLLPHIATGENHEALQGLRVPCGQGIVGYVAATGERVLVRDARTDPRFYSAADSLTGFRTRSILAVPLRTQTITLGGERGVVKEEIIGVAEALNKQGGQFFDEEDIQLFETLASQAATILQVAGLFEHMNELFFGVIAAFSASVDARDPYTQGHSLRVADYASAIARELGHSDEAIHAIRIGGMLHDIGKIGVPDAILNKPGRLTEQEYARMKEHPEIGERIMRQVPFLSSSIQFVTNALLEHHERLDGRGYPRGLRDDEISLIGRIIGVADVFDALTSGRPYREALPVEEAFRILRAGEGHEFDPACVEALIVARNKGNIKVQCERPDPNR